MRLAVRPQRFLCALWSSRVHPQPGNLTSRQVFNLRSVYLLSGPSRAYHDVCVHNVVRAWLADQP